MAFYSVDDVIVEVNKIVMKSDPQSLRSSIIRHIQAVYQKLGVDTFRKRITVLAKPQGNVIILPHSVFKVEAVWDSYGIIPQNEDSIIIDWSRHRRLSYSVDNNRIRLSKPEQQVLVTYITLPIDEKGEIVVDYRIFDATVDYCVGQELLAKGANVKQNYATLNPATFYIQQAREKIDNTRAAHSGDSLGSLIDYYNSIQSYVGEIH